MIYLNPHANQQRYSTKRNTGISATKTTVVPSPSYAIPASLAGIAAVAWVADVKALAGLAGVLGLFLAIQASRVKFIFDDEALVRQSDMHLATP